MNLRLVTSDKMKIAIIVDYLDDAPGSGIATYASNLTKNLIRIDSINDYFLVNSKKDTSLKDTQSIIIPRYQIPFGKEIRKLLVIPKILNQKQIDLVHETYHFGPFILPTKYKKIVTIHDLTSILFGKTHKTLSVIRHKLGLSLMLKRSDKIIAVSYSTKQDLMNYFKISDNKIKVIYEAADQIFQPLSSEKVQHFKDKYDLNYQYILYVGTLEPRKNIPLIIKAFYILNKEGFQHKLVIAGKKGWKYKTIYQLIDKLNLQKEVIFIGFIPDNDLPALYNAANLFVYPSLYEGFGLPPLEAMSCGCPVITSNISSLPEVVGDAGIMIDPYSVDELYEAMHKVLINEIVRKDMIKKGLERSQMFSWTKTAEETLKIYKEALNE